MKPTLTFVSLIAAVAAAPDPLITPRAELSPRQNSDPAVLGWVDATNGQFSDLRSCDFPATLSTSGALAQCCSGSSCTFWQSCSAGTLFAQSTSLRCDQGFCNTAVIVPTVGATSGQSYLGCWATSLGESAFTVIKDIGSAQPTAAPSSGSARSSANGNGASSRATSARSSAGGSGGSGSATQSSPGAAQSTGAAPVDAVKPLTGVFGLAAIFFGLL
ncbi:hypothetical protein BKA66DRAFT_573939 [Pyrenochaeta sp. MPI-SDFR-AT-0127]|nr:hypothetical protein BKA66DRAFT_573939 [Pyrenochaeta sp. MPI-SDFR-AT-0127]